MGYGTISKVFIITSGGGYFACYFWVTLLEGKKNEKDHDVIKMTAINKDYIHITTWTIYTISSTITTRNHTEQFQQVLMRYLFYYI